MSDTFSIPVAVYERMMIMLETATQNARDMPMPIDTQMTDDFLSCVYNDEIDACQSIIDRVTFAYENRNRVKN